MIGDAGWFDHNLFEPQERALECRDSATPVVPGWKTSSKLFDFPYDMGRMPPISLKSQSIAQK
jgi:hypothetical protein